jgi:hypothetical protein
MAPAPKLAGGTPHETVSQISTIGATDPSSGPVGFTLGPERREDVEANAGTHRSSVRGE